MKKYQKKIGKRLLALFLVFAMCLGMLNLTALAADSEQESFNIEQTVIDTKSVGEDGATHDKESAAIQTDNVAAVGGESSNVDGQMGVVQSDEQGNAVGSNLVITDNSDNAEDSGEVTAEPVKYTERGITYELYGDGTATAINGNIDKNYRIIIPEAVTYDGKDYNVTAIGARAFYNLGYVKEIVLPDGLETIGDMAFMYDYLYDNDLIIPDSVVSIEDYAFYGFHIYATDEYHINKVVLGKNLKTIGEQAFYCKPAQGYGNCLNFQVEVECYPNIESVNKWAFTYSGGTSMVSSVMIHDAYDGELDQVLNICYAFGFADKNYALGVDVNNIRSAAGLQKAINEAEEPTTLRLASDLYPFESIIIPGGKDITLVDNGNEIYIDSDVENDSLFIIEKGGKLTIDATKEENLVFNAAYDVKLNQTGKASMFQVDGTFVLKEGRINCSTKLPAGYSRPFCGDISLRTPGAKFLMEGGRIRGAYVVGAHTAPVLVGSGAEFNMTGGIITENYNGSSKYSGYAAGAVMIYGWSDGDVGGKMTLSGDAVISENTTKGVGGAITLVGNAELYMDGGVITGNRSLGGSSSNGGAVCVAGRTGGMSQKYDAKCMFTMDGGVISNNKAEYGGGIYVNSNYVQLNAGEIIGNKAHLTGGGVYVETPEIGYTAMHMKNALITQNTASVMGGGMYFCPTGTGTLYVDEGAAIFDNTAVGSVAAADDFVSVANWANSKAAVLAPRMLGGGLIEWYLDGTVTETAMTGGWGFVTSDSVRYDSENPKPVKAGTYEGNMALKSVVSDGAKQLAENSATLIIKENSAQRGGGVGANGSVTVGSDDKFNVNVNKVWDSSVPASEWKPITVQLVMNVDGKEYELEKAELSAANNWSAVFADLPASAKGHVDVKELDSEYVISYETKNDGNDVSFTITNSKLTSLTVNKVWVNDSESTRPAEVTVQLYDNNEASGEAVQLNADNGWSYTWNNLPVSGHEWTVGEVIVPDRYTSSQSTEGSVVTITNTYTPPKGPGTSYASLTVNKVWVNDSEDSRPANIAVQLYRDGSAYGRAVTLSADNDWSYTWSRLSKSSTWTVGEVNVPAGYTSAVSRTGSVVTITNTYSETEIDEPDVPLTDKPDNPDDPDVPQTLEEVDLPDPNVPLADDPGISTDVELNDPAVPLANSPKTGDDSFPWLWVVVASGVGLALLIAGEQKRRRNAD